MKKLFALALAVMLVASMTTVAFAAESTTTLTATVPAATYTLNIPANQEIPFGTTETEIGQISVSESAGFASGKNLEVTVVYTPFTASGITTEIPYTLSLDGTRLAADHREGNLASGSIICFEGNTNGTVNKCPTFSNFSDYDKTVVILNALSEDWGKALAGEYTSTITFTAEVVVEE